MLRESRSRRPPSRCQIVFALRATLLAFKVPRRPRLRLWVPPGFSSLPRGTVEQGTIAKSKGSQHAKNPRKDLHYEIVLPVNHKPPQTATWRAHALAVRDREFAAEEYHGRNANTAQASAPSARMILLRPNLAYFY